MQQAAAACFTLPADGFLSLLCCRPLLYSLVAARLQQPASNTSLAQKADQG